MQCIASKANVSQLLSGENIVGLYDTKITSQYSRLFSNNDILNYVKILHHFGLEVTGAVGFPSQNFRLSCTVTGASTWSSEISVMSVLFPFHNPPNLEHFVLICT